MQIHMLYMYVFLTFKLMLSCGSDSFDDLYMNSSTLSVSITGAVRGREKHNIANNIKECTCVAKCISIIKSYALQPQENTRDRCVKMLNHSSIIFITLQY